MTLEIEQFPCRSDNFGVLLHDTESGATAAIDAPEEKADPRQARREELASRPHLHHPSPRRPHRRQPAAQGGFQATITGPAGEAAKIPGIDKTVKEGDSFRFGDYEVRVIATPGHTLGHITYWMPGAGVAFVGDTLFAIGCGRVIEGTPEMMWEFAVEAVQPSRRDDDLLRPRIHAKPTPASRSPSSRATPISSSAPAEVDASAPPARRPCRRPSASRRGPIRSCAPTSRRSAPPRAAGKPRPRSSPRSAGARTISNSRSRVGKGVTRGHGAGAPCPPDSWSLDRDPPHLRHVLTNLRYG